MRDERKRIAVVIDATTAPRVAEALRAAVGLSLRGDRVQVLLTRRATPHADDHDPAIARALATLATLGHTVAREPGGAMRDADSKTHASEAHELSIGHFVRTGDAVQVWT
jgi:predicted RNA-binding Zn ribbon-like protein